MVREAAAELTAYVRRKVGDGLRAVVVVTEDGWTTTYLRDDLREEYDESAFGAVVDGFRSEASSPGIGDSPVGERRALVHYHEEAFVLQLPVSSSEAVLVGISSDAGPELLGFIENCRQLVAEEA